MSVKFKKEAIKAFRDSSELITWSLKAGEIGEVFVMPGQSERSVQFSGVFSDAYIVLEGSNNGEDFVSLTDPQGNPIRKSIPALEGILETVRFVRPVVYKGDKNTEITVSLFYKPII